MFFLRILRILTISALIASTLAATTFTFKCSSALLCVDDNLCDPDGVISETPVTLTEEQQAIPRNICKKSGGGEGICCRDPNYKDDWPANYVDPGLPKPKPPPPPPPGQADASAPAPAPPKPISKPVEERPVQPPPPTRIELPEEAPPSSAPAPPSPSLPEAPAPPAPEIPAPEPAPPVTQAPPPAEPPSKPPKTPAAPKIRKQKNFVNTGCPERNRVSFFSKKKKIK